MRRWSASHARFCCPPLKKDWCCPVSVSADAEHPQLLAASYRLILEEGRKDRYPLLRELALNATDVEELL
jgi:hypothetical protein